MAEKGMPPGFEVFDRSWQGRRSSEDPAIPRVSLQKIGNWSLNEAALVALGRPTHVVLLFDPNERLVAFRGAEHGEEDNAYKVRFLNPQRGSREGRGVIVSGTAFCRHYGIPHEKLQSYQVSVDGGVLVVGPVGEAT